MNSSSLFWYSYLKREQKALIKAYAESDDEINGTVDNLTSTKKGIYNF